jgi:hypothetical protein
MEAKVLALQVDHVASLTTPREGLIMKPVRNILISHSVRDAEFSDDAIVKMSVQTPVTANLKRKNINLDFPMVIFNAI